MKRSELGIQRGFESKPPRVMFVVYDLEQLSGERRTFVKVKMVLLQLMSVRMTTGTILHSGHQCVKWASWETQNQ